jgi:secondary thiamine-phosphate synthase enzyme
MLETITVKSSSRCQFIDVTGKVAEVVSRTGIKDGIVTVYVSHTTAGVTINESADPAVVDDILARLAQLVPYSAHYKHSEGNSDAHIKSSMMGSSVQVIIAGGSLQLGTWQGIFFCEFDGPRPRKILVKVMPG